MAIEQAYIGGFCNCHARASFRKQLSSPRPCCLSVRARAWARG